MKRIDTANRSVDMFGPGRDGFATAVAGVSQPTYLSAQFCNAVQEALVRVIERAGLVPTDDYNQFSEAVFSVTEAQALLAAAARLGAESARDAAIIGAGVYVDEPTGRAAVADGQAFKVQGSGDVAAFEYRRTSSAASVLIAAYPSALEKIAPARTSFLIPGKNLFDKSRIARGKYLTETGLLADNPTYDVSDFIAVTPGQTYHANGQGMRFTCFSDMNRVLVAGGSDIGLNPFVAPAGAAYVRVTMFHSDIDKFQFEHGDDATAYEPFYYQLRLASGVKIAPPAESLPNGWLPPEKTSFLQVGKNRFNRKTVTVGRYIVATGALLENPNYDTSDYIPVRPGAYTCNLQGIRFSCNYDANKNVIPGGYDGAVSVGTLVIPEGVAFIRIAVAHDSVSLQLEEGNAPTGFEQYGLYFKGENNTPLQVTPQATNFLQVGKNLFNQRTVTVGRYLSPGGVEAENANYDYSDYIAVEPGTYVFNAAVVRMSCLFNEHRVVVPGGYDENALIDRITIPSGVAFIRFTVPHYGIEAIQLERGNVSTPFEEYRYELRAADGTPIAVDGAGTPGTPAMEAPVLATTHYVPAGKELALYYENIVRDFQAHAGHIGISMSADEESSKETGEARKLLPVLGQVNTTVNGSATVVGSSFDFVAGAAGKWYQVRITDPANTTPINMGSIGDSFSGRMTWTNVINATPAAAGITYSGNRTANSTNQPVKCEGQGGWTMESYFTVDNRGYLSPFMQPVNNFKHFGPTSFWIDANSASPSYNATYFFGIRDQFDAVTGRKKAPAVGDVMSEGGGYIVWTGAAWAAITLETLGGFAFSYAKYRAAWGIPRQDILHVLLGTNDFYSADANTFPGTYALYKARYEQLIASVKADSPACKIIVGIPVSSGRQGEYGTLNTERVKRAMWLLAKSLNADFGEREAEGIYVLDYHSIVHRVYGFDTTPEKPMADYAGPDTYKYTVDITHCSEAGFAQMGNAYMGLVQYLRSQM
ncbi:SGNH/GDSL hydrolase family protein [Janthinobacterium sp. PSPC2-1]|uniref:SGNH/GDSL hydrolase family protein n=1 Tax=unclassified Janthinobacterium TaxID=2610881 RepID=UPI003CEED700